MAENSSPLLDAWQLVQYLFLFGLVLGLAYVSTRGLRRLAPFAKGKHLRLIDQLHLGTNRSFYLLGVADRVVLVAMGEGGVSTVATLDDPKLVEGLLAESVPSPASAADLSGWLRAMRAPAARLGEALRPARPGESVRAFEAALQTATARQVPPPEETELRRRVARLKKLVEKTEV